MLSLVSGMCGLKGLMCEMNPWSIRVICHHLSHKGIRMNADHPLNSLISLQQYWTVGVRWVSRVDDFDQNKSMKQVSWVDDLDQNKVSMRWVESRGFLDQNKIMRRVSRVDDLDQNKVSMRWVCQVDFFIRTKLVWDELSGVDFLIWTELLDEWVEWMILIRMRQVSQVDDLDQNKIMSWVEWMILIWIELWDELCCGWSWSEQSYEMSESSGWSWSEHNNDMSDLSGWSWSEGRCFVK